MREVVAYERLKTKENHKQWGPKSCRGRLQQQLADGRLLKVPTVRLWLGKFWMGGGYPWKFDRNLLEQNGNFPLVVSRSNSSDSSPPYPSHL